MLPRRNGSEVVVSAKKGKGLVVVLPHLAANAPAAASWPMALQSILASPAMHKQLLRDAATAATARAQASHDAYSHGTTFWVGALDAARCSLTTLERVALDLFYSHVRRMQIQATAIREEERIQEQDDQGSTTATATTIIDWTTSGAEWWTLSMDGADGGVGWH